MPASSVSRSLREDSHTRRGRLQQFPREEKTSSTEADIQTSSRENGANGTGQAETQARPFLLLSLLLLFECPSDTSPEASNPTPFPLSSLSLPPFLIPVSTRLKPRSLPSAFWSLLVEKNSFRQLFNRKLLPFFALVPRPSRVCLMLFDS